ncbi:MAG: hypothetical protein E7539_02205 [Ruminococcaceae bacterium]|nr:hypothetical protein [Oscillospiraceae bacterium]
MKPFLGIDITENKKNEAFNGEEFIIARPSSALSAAFDKTSEEFINVISESRLPIAIRIGHWICGTVGAIVAIGIIKALTGNDSISLAQAYQNADWLFWVGGICLVAWLILKIISNKKQKTVLESDESNNVFSNFDKVAENIYQELKVPTDAKEVDVLSFAYKTKNGSVVAKERGLETTPYSNLVFRIHKDAENMYLTDREAKYCFALSSLKNIKKINKTISVPIWHKDTEPNEGEYKQYKIFSNNLDDLCFKPYYILELEHNNEVWGIYFPCYELPIFEEITGLKAE